MRHLDRISVLLDANAGRHFNQACTSTTQRLKKKVIKIRGIRSKRPRLNDRFIPNAMLTITIYSRGALTAKT